MMLKEIKPKNARSARALAKRAPLEHENPKATIFLKGTGTSSLVNSLLADLHSLKRPFAIKFTKKNDIHPFEDAASLEFFSQKNDASLLCFGSHTKKRPHCLTFVRCFGGMVLDMVECLVQQDTARILAQFKGAKCKVGVKPLISFSGSQFEDPVSEGSEGEFALAKSIFLDFFRGGEAKEVDVEGLQWMINFTASEEEVEGGPTRKMVYMRCWKLATKRSGQKLPRVEVEEMGPRIDFKIGRVRNAEQVLLREAMKKAKGTEAKQKKNVETDIVGDKMGRIHLGRQDLSDLQTRKMKGLKRGREDNPEVEGEEEAESASEGSESEVFDGIGSDDDDSESDGESGGVDFKRPRLE